MTISPPAPPHAAVAGHKSHLCPRICIVGGGFGGLYTAVYLQKYRHLRNCEITLVEPQEQFLFTPLLYEVLTDELQVWEIAPTYSSLVAGKNIHWKQDRAVDVNLAERQVTLARGEVLPYDYLVMATGAVTRKVETPGVENYAQPFRTLNDALTLKTRLEQLAATHSSPSIIVVGGGASGVELATKVSDRLKGRAQVVLIDRGNAILKPFAQGLRRAAEKALKKRGVEVWYHSSVDEITDRQVLGQRAGQTFVRDCDLTIWATGTQPLGWLGSDAVASNEYGQVWVKPTLQLIDHAEVFMLGDSAVIQGAAQPNPNTAQAAYQGADAVAKSLAAMVKGKSAQPFHYLHLGDMLTLGAGAGGVWSFGLTMSGKLGGLVRRAVYIYRLPTRRHRLKVARNALKQLFRLGRKPAKTHRAALAMREDSY
ncbi:MAG: NAD(P)/FAD-dependent oxidoreductase [Cyanobacteria bacterium J06632_22]